MNSVVNANNNDYHILDEESLSVLYANRDVLIEFVVFTDEFIRMCIERKVVSGENVMKFRVSNNNAERIDSIINTLKMKTNKYFTDFLEILTLTNHSHIVNLIMDTEKQFDDEIKDINEKVPLVRKIIKQDDRHQLIEYIKHKLKVVYNRSILHFYKNENSKSSEARKAQVEDNYSHRNEIRSKDRETNELKDQMDLVEKQLQIKQKELRQAQDEINQIVYEKQQELEISQKFNLANDKLLQSNEKSLEIYKSSLFSSVDKIQEILMVKPASYSKVNIYDDFVNVQIINDLFIKLKLEFEKLREDCKQWEILKAEVKNVLVNCLGYPATSSLTQATVNYIQSVNSKLNYFNENLSIAEGFIFNQLPIEVIPVEYKDVKLKTNERREYEKLIEQLQTNIVKLQDKIDYLRHENDRVTKLNAQRNFDSYISTNKPDKPLPQQTTSLTSNNNVNVKIDNLQSTIRPKTPHLTNYKLRGANIKMDNRSLIKPGTIKFL